MPFHAELIVLIFLVSSIVPNAGGQELGGGSNRMGHLHSEAAKIAHLKAQRVKLEETVRLYSVKSSRPSLFSLRIQYLRFQMRSVIATLRVNQAFINLLPASVKVQLVKK
jgi:hypothetical protein